MKLTVVGCAPSYTQRPRQASSCYLVEHDGTAIVLDMGQAAFAALAQHQPPAELTAVLISHLHPDHFVDLVPLRHFLKYGAGGVGVALHGPAELPRRIDGLMNETDFLAPLSFVALAPGERDLGTLRVEARHVTHIADSFAFRLAPTAGSQPGLVYSGDCGRADDLLPLIRPGDTLLCEAAFGAATTGAPMHLSAGEAAAVAQRAGAAALVLTHVLDDQAAEKTLAAAAGFDGRVELARPDLVIEVG